LYQALYQGGGERAVTALLDLYTLDAAGNPVRCADWVTWATSDFRVARTEVGSGYVSTIFLGWQSPRPGPARLFETMVCGLDGVEFEERHATRAEALIGHARAVAYARQQLDLAAAYAADHADDGPEAA